MDASDLRLHRTALIGAAAAVTVGLTGGLLLRTGPQTTPEAEFAYTSEASYAQVEPIAWPAGKVPDYVIGTDFLRAQQSEPPPIVVASYEVPEYVPAVWSEPTPPVQPVGLAHTDQPSWPSTSGDILNTRLPEDAPRPPEPPEAPIAPVAPTPLTMAAY
ncbi:hypothetical protein [Caulobacter sp.]|uniref:hypothetical protein n=1 Tax=Caulobacter sp. TaxID=78 RepID=UPI003BAFD5FE